MYSLANRLDKQTDLIKRKDQIVEIKRVGMLTGGGDCPGLNPVIRGAVQTLANRGVEVYGLLEGWRGALEGNYDVLTPENTRRIVSQGGTILGSSRTNPFKNENDEGPVDQVLKTMSELGLDALIAIGGDDTLGVANKLHQRRGFKTIGVPKTIDNDLSCTDVTFGFDTALNTVVDSVEKLRTTAESHRRVMVVETMGRHAGWIAYYSGVAVGADYILIPERESDFDHLCKTLEDRRQLGQKSAIVVVSEGAKLAAREQKLVTKDANVDEFGHVSLGGVGEIVANIIEQRLDWETRCVVLGHLQRGGAPSAYDRILGTRMGVHAARLVLAGDWGKMVAAKGNDIIPVSLAEAVGTMRTVNDSIIDEIEEFYR
jgi:ATP-dependent phosphofructokinase / diphosphate-dependent phosphofructokinase